MVPRSLRVLAGLAAMATPAAADVTLVTPSGGEVLRSGDKFTIEWRVEAPRTSHSYVGSFGTQHRNGCDWDLWYSTEGPTGPFSPIVLDLPAGSMQVGSMHSFEWTVPDTSSGDVWIRLRMDTSGRDLWDDSDAPMTIGPAASAIFRNGTDYNVTCLTAFNTPVLGDTWEVEVSHGHHPGATHTMVVCYGLPATGPIIPAGELLVDLTSPRGILNSMVSTGTVDHHSIPVPYDLSILGASATMQAIIHGGAGSELCNAYDTVVGL